MKILFALVLLSFSLNASASDDLQCRLENSSGVQAKMVKKSALDGTGMVHTTFTVTKLAALVTGTKIETIEMYVTKSGKNQLSETVYSGIAERQVQIDVFDKFKFVVRVPNILENGVKVIFTNNDGSDREEFDFKCVRPDNR